MKRIAFLLAMVCCFGMMGCNDAKFPIEESPTVKVDTRMLGIWKINDRAYRNGTYEIKKVNDYEFEVAALDTAAETPYCMAQMCNGHIFLSKVKDGLFLNVESREDSFLSYSFRRLLSIDAAGSKMSLATFADTALSDLKSSTEVKKYIEDHMNDAVFYKDTVQLFRIR